MVRVKCFGASWFTRSVRVPHTRKFKVVAVIVSGGNYAIVMGMDNDPSARLRSIDWDQLLLVYLHDPIDKALDIRGHESRAARYASRALDREVTRDEIKSTASLADQLASRAERLPMPTAGPDGERAVGPEDGRIEVRHPVSAQPGVLEGLAIDEVGVLEAIGSIVDGLPDPRSRFLALWRLLPERLAERLGQGLARLPADTRVPDHTLVQHADITSGLWASREGAHGGALLSVSLGPVQSFIAAARSVRDLWSGSAILSWLTFQGIRPVLETLGPTALVYPALRGNPLMDLWLRNDAGLDDVVPLPPEGSRRSPSLPNRFVALVPWGSGGTEAHDMADTCEKAIRAAWRRLADNVHSCLDRSLSSLDPGWAGRWREQVDSFFEVRTATLPIRDMKDDTLASMIGGAKAAFDSVWPEAAKVRGLADAIPGSQRPSYQQRAAGLWQAQLEASARLMEAQRSIRHVPTSQTAQDEASPPKCSLLGSYEQMGPAGLDDSRAFWEKSAKALSVEGVRLRDRERFSAVALCKRFAAPVFLANEFGLEPSDLRFPDTATVAAVEWLAKAGIDPDQVRREHKDWNGRWLHQKRSEDVDEGDTPPPDSVWRQIREERELKRPPAYYAILAMDADHMGQWLKGDRAPKVRKVLHRKMVDYYEGLGDKAKAGLDAKRPVGPALHASISEALNNFASHIAPGIVERHRGTMIYSGGDDVLALLPARRAVECTAELYRAFRGEDGGPPGWTERDGRQLLTMGNQATLSAGIAFVHHMEDLRLALAAARQAEEAAKDGGRDSLTLRFMRRSGEHSRAGLSWMLTPWFQELVEIFVRGATVRWAYRLRQELPTLQGRNVPEAAVSAEIRRLVDRTKGDDETADSPGPSGSDVERWWQAFSKARKERGRAGADLLEEFTLLCQGASFVARGHDG